MHINEKEKVQEKGIKKGQGKIVVAATWII